MDNYHHRFHICSLVVFHVGLCCIQFFEQIFCITRAFVLSGFLLMYSFKWIGNAHKCKLNTLYSWKMIINIAESLVLSEEHKQFYPITKLLYFHLDTKYELHPIEFKLFTNTMTAYFYCHMQIRTTRVTFILTNSITYWMVWEHWLFV